MKDFFEKGKSDSEQLLEECHYLFHALDVDDIELAVNIAEYVLPESDSEQVKRIAQIYINDAREA